MLPLLYLSGKIMSIMVIRQIKIRTICESGSQHSFPQFEFTNKSSDLDTVRNVSSSILHTTTGFQTALNDLGAISTV